MKRSLVPATLRNTVWLCLALAFVIPLDAQEASQLWLGPWLKVATETDTIITACGVSRNGKPIPVLLPKAFVHFKGRQRVLLVVQESADSPLAAQILEEWADFRRANPAASAQVGIVPYVFPDARPKTLTSLPPEGNSYGQTECPELAYLWRYLGNLAPDLVVVIESGAELVWQEKPASGSLAGALNSEKVAGVGTIRAVSATLPAGDKQGAPKSATKTILGKVEQWGRAGAKSRLENSAREELIRRLDRTPVEVATELSHVYGHKLPSVAYIPSLALVGRIRLGQLTGDETHLRDVREIVTPYVDGTKSSLGNKPSGSTLSGHLIFGELAKVTSDPRYIQLAKVAADLGFDAFAQPKASMPFHSEMSDSVFMGTPILTVVGRLTGEQRYYAMAQRHLEFMLRLNLREDGLHQHSPIDSDATAWGRGNGFPALGLAWALTDLPPDHKRFAPMLKVYTSHLDALLPHQDEMGMWHQVIDRPESYREFTSTCMITYAIVRGLRAGWLKGDKYETAVLNAWPAIKRRVGAGGLLSDVCTGTGKQKSLREYYDRTAILDRDDRGGAMALMVSTEVAFAMAEKNWPAVSSTTFPR
jgi:unsaturated rhamnogalacturonyl hydrolase